jgi:hypothetical protein
MDPDVVLCNLARKMKCQATQQLGDDLQVGMHTISDCITYAPATEALRHLPQTGGHAAHTHARAQQHLQVPTSPAGCAHA